jgi:hypothetical protein
MTPESNLTERGGAVARKTKVRTTFEPHVVISIDDRELEDLERQGLIYSASREGFGSHDWEDEAKSEAESETAPAATSTKKKEG